MGQVLTGDVGQNPARQAAINAGIPKEKTSYIVNQVCGSGLRSIVAGYQSILLGDAKIVIAGGQESMTNSKEEMMLKDGLPSYRTMEFFLQLLMNYLILLKLEHGLL